MTVAPVAASSGPQRRARLPLGLEATRLADGAAAAAGLLALVLLARALPTVELARFGVALAVATVLAAVLDAGAATLLAPAAGVDPARHGRAALGSLLGRAPLVVAVGAIVLAGGAVLQETALAAAAFLYALAAAAGLTLCAVVRARGGEGVELRAKLVLATATPAVVAVAVHVRETAAAALLGFAVAAALALAVLVRHVQRTAAWDRAAPPLAVVAAGLPYGLLAVAGLVYYRSGTLVLAAVGDHEQTAAFALAGALGFAAMTLPAAVTAPVLADLSAQQHPRLRRALVRDAARWATLVCLLGGVTLCAFARYGVEPVLGPRWHAVAAPLAILGLSLPVVGASTVVGTVLVAERRVAPLAVQAGLSLAVNVAFCLALVPVLGASGAALSVVLTETTALVVLVASVWNDSPTIVRLRRQLVRAARAAAVAGAAGTLAWLAVTAVASGYAVRLTIGPGLAGTPRDELLGRLGPDGAAFAGPDGQVAPYSRLLAWLWRVFALETDAAGRPAPDGRRVALLLALVGLAAAAATLCAVYAWARAQAGRRAATLTVPVVLVLLGPAHVAAAGDLTFHGLLYGAYLPQTVATASLLAALAAVTRRDAASLAAASLGVLATFLLDPVSGVLLAGLLGLQSAWLGLEREPGWWRGTGALAAGFALALAWPGYDVERAARADGLPAGALVAFFVALGASGPLLPRLDLWSRLPDRRRELAAATRLAWAGLAATLLLAAWSVRSLTRPDAGPAALYWTHTRLPLLLAGGAAGLVGLARLLRSGRPQAAAWLAGCLALGVAGALALPVPAWPRLLLLCQVPLALGLAIVLTELRAPRMRLAVAAGLAVAVVFKVATLVGLPARVTPFRGPAPDLYALERSSSAARATASATGPGR